MPDIDNYLNRRVFIKKSLFSASVFYWSLSTNPQALGQENPREAIIKNKKGLRTLNDRPLNMETPPHLLDDEVTPNSRLFVRNNGLIPPVAFGQNLDSWTLPIDGGVKKKLSFTLNDLKTKFKQYSYQLVLECGGNGRAGFHPKAKGNQWTYGAIGCPLWHGVRLADVLEAAGLKESAIFLAFYGHDLHPSGDAQKTVISRGFPISKALDPMTMLAFGMNNKDLPPTHGFPLRLICPGYPGSASGKWLKRLWVRDRIHDGPKMGGYSYRIPKTPVAAGSSVLEKDMKIITKMPVKSLITYPKSGLQHDSHKKEVNCRGFAWTGENKITRVDLSYDFGQTWLPTTVKAAPNKFAWQRWSIAFKLPSKGYYEIWARAQDDTGKMQSMLIPGWNPKGYLNNAMPRIAINVLS